jgi:hypothetical protein
LESGLYLPGNGKALVKLKGPTGTYLLAAGQNRGPLKMFELKRIVHEAPLQPSDISATLTFKNGSSRKQEIYYGASYLSQSGRLLNLDDQVIRIILTGSNGKSRRVSLQ